MTLKGLFIMLIFVRATLKHNPIEFVNS